MWQMWNFEYVKSEYVDKIKMWRWEDVNKWAPETG